MRALLIKTSSLGDVVHTLPALTDASRAIHGLQIDWLVEEAFAEIPSWHPAVTRVLPVAVRRWRKDLLNVRCDVAWKRLRAALDNQSYDLILDAQGLLKSAWLGWLADGPRAGLDRASAREALASLFYHKTYRVAKENHAVERTRHLFAQAFNYPLPTTRGSYGIARERVSTSRLEADKLMFLHGTTWASKHYPENYWIDLAKIARRNKFRVVLPWSNDQELERARRISRASEALVLDKLSLRDLAKELATAGACIAVDSGLGHMACALGVPTLSLYGPTKPALTSTYGDSQKALAVQFPCAPCLHRKCQYRDGPTAEAVCFDTLTPTRIWTELQWALSRQGPLALAAS